MWELRRGIRAGGLLAGLIGVDFLESADDRESEASATERVPGLVKYTVQLVAATHIYRPSP